MSENKKKIPQRRFKEFQNSDAWEQRKLGDITTSFSGGTPSAGNTLYYGGTIPFIRSGEISSEQTELFLTEEGLNNSSAKLVDKGDILYALYGATSGEVSISRISGAINQAILALKPLENYNSQFIMQWLRKEKENIIGTYLQGGQGNLSGNIVKELMVSIPKNKTEQDIIGAYFSNLDNIITLHQRKLEKIKAAKKAYLSEMFPAEGESKPKRRFAGFTDDWEQRKFSDNIVAIQTGTNLLGGLSNSGTPLLKMGNIQRGYFSLDKLEHLDINEKVEEENIAYYGDFFFNTRNTLELVGKGATWTGEGGKYAFNSNIARFTFKGIDTIFFNYLYNTQDMIKQVHARAMGTTSVAAIYPHNLNSLEYKLPSIEEQKAIGIFFIQLDNLITLHQRKLDKLQNIKKAYLNEMFI